MLRRLLKRILCIALVLLAPATSYARPPEVRNLDLRGLQIGAPTTLTIDGADLLRAPRVFLDDKPVEAAIDPKSTATRVVLTVTPPADSPAGIALLRLGTVDGFSNSVPVGIDRLPQSVIAEETKALPA